MVKQLQITSLTKTLSAYETVLLIFLLIAIGFLILAGNLYINQWVQDPAVGQIFFTSIILLLLALVGWFAYNQLGEKISYEYTDPKMFPIAALIVFGAWAFGYFYWKYDIYRATLASAIDPVKLAQYLKFLAPLFLILFAFVENLLIVVVIPMFIIEKVFGKSITQASFTDKLIASIIAGLVAVILHIAWKPLPALVTTFIYFTSWALATLLLRSSILADIVHMLGNALGWLYITVYPTYLI